MGRWSRQNAPSLPDWLARRWGLDWLEIGCGTGVISDVILARCNPKSLIFLDRFEGFLEKGRPSVPDGRAESQVGH